MKKFITTILLLAISAFGEQNILEKIDARMSPSGVESYKKLVNIEPDGSKKEFLLYQLKKDKDKMISLFLKPDSEKGRSTLRLGENMWLYLPDVGKPIRITSMQSVTGGIFNNSDIMKVDYAAEYDLVSQKEQDAQIILELKAKHGTVAYDKLIMYVDPKTTTPTKVICYTSTGILIKTLYFKDIKEFGGGIIRPAIMETDSPLYKGYKSIIITGKMEPKELVNEVFTLENMGKVQEMR